MSRAVLALLIVPVLAAVAGAQTSLMSFPGPASSEASPVCGGHDLDGDLHDDVVVGAPFDDTSAGNAGAVRAYSGKTGALLWVRYGAKGLDGLGWSLAMSPDHDGDGVRDVAAGAPFALQSGSHRPGCLFLFSGKTGATLGIFWGTFDNEGTGISVAADFDWDRDGTADLAAGAPYQARMRVWSGATGILLVNSSSGPGSGYGTALASVGDIDQDGFGDLAVGAPFDAAIGVERGVIWVWGATNYTILGLTDHEHLGAALSPGPDIDLDGSPDLLAGLPDSDAFGTDAGLVRAYSLFTTPNGKVVRAWGGDAPGDRFGASVAEIGDVDGDGTRDFVAGAPVNGSGAGYARVVSARFGTPLFDVQGAPVWTSFGEHVADAGDVNRDGIPDFAVGNPDWFTLGQSEGGRVEVFSGSCPGFVSYCTAGASASGCSARISATGTPSAVLPLSFELHATGVEGAKDGLFFFGWNGRQANPWGNGTSFQCVVPPVKRGGVLPGTGTPGACDGAFSQDLNALWQAQPAKNPGVGAVVQAQFWYRDPQSTSNQSTSLSDALELAVCP